MSRRRSQTEAYYRLFQVNSERGVFFRLTLLAFLNKVLSILTTSLVFLTSHLVLMIIIYIYFIFWHLVGAEGNKFKIKIAFGKNYVIPTSLHVYDESSQFLLVNSESSVFYGKHVKSTN